MIGDAHAEAMTRHLAEELAGTGKYVAISEFGALWFDDGEEAVASRMNVPTGSHMMSHAVYMASQFMHQRNLNLGWVEGNDLIGPGNALRTLIGGPSTDHVFSAEAIVREGLAPAFTVGSRWLSTETSDVEKVGLTDKYPAIVSGASRTASGEVRVIVVNRSVESTTVTIDPGALRHGATIRVLTTAGMSYESAMGPLGDNSVATTETSLSVATQIFRHTLPPASVTTFAWIPCE